MSDETTTETQQETTVTEAAVDKGGQSGNFTPPATQADLDKIIADRLSRERAKFSDYDDLKTKAAEYDKAVEESKTEAQKQAERLAELESKVAEYETREQIAAWKSEVSAETGVPANVLAGTTKEEIAAHAESLKPLIEAAEKQAEPARPGVVPTIGKTPETPGNVSLADQIAAAEASGDKATVMALKAMQLGSVTTTNT